jgi:hypothetical protein
MNGKEINNRRGVPDNPLKAGRAKVGVFEPLRRIQRTKGLRGVSQGNKPQCSSTRNSPKDPKSTSATKYKGSFDSEPSQPMNLD